MGAAQALNNHISFLEPEKTKKQHNTLRALVHTKGSISMQVGTWQNLVVFFPLVCLSEITRCSLVT